MPSAMEPRSPNDWTTREFPRRWFLTVKGHKAKSAKSKGAWGKVWRKPCTSPFLVKSQGTPWVPTAEMWQHVWNVYQESPVPRVPAAGGGWSSFKLQDSRRKAGVGHKPHCSYSLGNTSHLYHLESGRNTPEIQIPIHQAGPTLQIGLRTATSGLIQLTLLCTAITSVRLPKWC